MMHFAGHTLVSNIENKQHVRENMRRREFRDKAAEELKNIISLLERSEGKY